MTKEVSRLEEFQRAFETRLAAPSEIKDKQLFVKNYQKYDSRLLDEFEEDLCADDISVKRLCTYKGISKLDDYRLLTALASDSTVPELVEQPVNRSTVHNAFDIGEDVHLTYYTNGTLFVEGIGIYNTIIQGLKTVCEDYFVSETLVIQEKSHEE